MAENRFYLGKPSGPTSVEGSSGSQHHLCSSKVDHASAHALVIFVRLLARQAAAEALKEHSEALPSLHQEITDDC